MSLTNQDSLRGGLGILIGLVRLTGGVVADHVILGQVDGIISVSILID